MKNKENCLGEVIESSLSSWKGQCWDWDEVSSFGSVVSTESHDREIFGLVYAIETGSLDLSRTPFAYQKTEQELLAEQPQIFEFLKTTFSCLTLGYKEKEKIHHVLAPKPPKIHSFIGLLNKEASKEFFAKQSYLQLIFGHESLLGNIDELLLALISHARNQEILDEDTLAELIQNLSLLTGNDYRRSKLFLQRVEAL